MAWNRPTPKNESKVKVAKRPRALLWIVPGLIAAAVAVAGVVALSPSKDASNRQGTTQTVIQENQKQDIRRCETDIDGYTWSYRVCDDGTAVVTKVWPKPTGDIVIPSTLGGLKVTGVGKGAFSYRSSSVFRSVIIPDGVTSIGERAFYDCSGLTSVAIPSTVTNIGNWAFSGCRGLTSVTIPEGVTRIGEGAFASCNGLKSVKMFDGVTSIGEMAFFGCRGLTSVTIPASVTHIEANAFKRTPFYDNLPDGIVVLGAVLCKYKGNCRDLIIPMGVKSIEFSEECDRRVSSVTIPASVTNIRDRSCL